MRRLENKTNQRLVGHPVHEMMMDFDRRPSKFEQEQVKRREEVKRRKQQEERLEQAQRQRERELAELAIKRREEQEKAEAERMLAEAEEARQTGGVRFTKSLAPYAIEGDDDKVILPEECLADLTEQDVFGKRPALFRIAAALGDGRQLVSHAGVREFSAQPGTIGLPPKVIDSLGGDLMGIKSLQIKYVVLSKVTAVKLRPKDSLFFEVGPVKRCLEDNLVLHATLTVGDLLTVWYRGRAHKLVVTELLPEAQGSLLDTDITVDLELSEQTQQAQAQVLGKRLSDTAAPVSAPMPMEVDEELLPEPAAQESGVLMAKVKLPNGRTCTRRFAHSMPLGQLFLFVRKEAALDNDSMSISTRFPARTFTVAADAAKSFADCGLAVASEQFFVKYS